MNKFLLGREKISTEFITVFIIINIFHLAGHKQKKWFFRNAFLKFSFKYYFDFLIWNLDGFITKRELSSLFSKFCSTLGSFDRERGGKIKWGSTEVFDLALIPVTSHDPDSISHCPNQILKSTGTECFDLYDYWLLSWFESLLQRLSRLIPLNCKNNAQTNTTWQHNRKRELAKWTLYKRTN